MRRIACINITKVCANLILIGFSLSILFGQGIHFHTIFDHLFDHGDIHVYVHSHSHSSDHEHDEGTGFDLKDSHNHPIAKLNLKSVRTTTPHQNGFQVSQSFAGVISGDSESIADHLHATYLDLPPPYRISDIYHLYSFSLRAPPVG